MEMICLNCKNRFNCNSWEKTIKCPKCKSYITASAKTYDAKIGYEKDLKEAKQILRKKWRYYFGSN